MIRKYVKVYLEIEGVTRLDLDSFLHRWTIWGLSIPKPSFGQHVADSIRPTRKMRDGEWVKKVQLAVSEVTEYKHSNRWDSSKCPNCGGTMEDK